MHHFDYQDGVLHAEGVDLVALAAHVGTPFYCYSSETLERHYTVFAGAFADVPALVCYAMKANSNQSVLMTLAILTFVGMWNSYFFPLIMINSPELQVITVGLTLLRGQYGAGALGPIAAALTMAIVPVLIVFLLLQKYIIKSIVSTGLKT